MAVLSLETLNRLGQSAFVRTLGDVFEHSPWIAQEAHKDRPFSSLDALHAAMTSVVQGASEAKQLALIRAHPELAGKAALAGDLTESSSREQGGAGLDRLDEPTFERFHALNNAYKAKFDFPFVLAVKGHTADSILASFEARLENSVEEEKRRALAEIGQIARFRLETLLEGERA